VSERYIRQERTARSTGTVVQVLDLCAPGTEFDPERDADGNLLNRWATVCCTHGQLCTHPTLALAEAHAAAPEGWCDDCRPLA